MTAQIKPAPLFSSSIFASKQGRPAESRRRHRSREIVKLLLNNGANRRAQYQDGRLPIDLAIKAEHLEIAALLKPT